MTAVSSQSPASEHARVLVFFDYACAFCYLDWPRFKRLAAEEDAEIILCPYELRPEMPAEGISIEELGGRHSERVREHMDRMAREGGLCYTEQDLVPNSHLALALSEFARDVSPGRHYEVHEAIWRAHFCDGANIGDPEVLLHVAGVHGLDVGLVREAFEQHTYDERLHQFRHLALAFGVQATPSALVCNELFIGTRPYEVLAESVKRCMMRPTESLQGVIVETVGREAEGEPATIRGG